MSYASVEDIEYNNDTTKEIIEIYDDTTEPMESTDQVTPENNTTTEQPSTSFDHSTETATEPLLDNVPIENSVQSPDKEPSKEPEPDPKVEEIKYDYEDEDYQDILNVTNTDQDTLETNFNETDDLKVIKSGDGVEYVTEIDDGDPNNEEYDNVTESSNDLVDDLDEESQEVNLGKCFLEIFRVTRQKRTKIAKICSNPPFIK